MQRSVDAIDIDPQALRVGATAGMRVRLAMLGVLLLVALVLALQARQSWQSEQLRSTDGEIIALPGAQRLFSQRLTLLATQSASEAGPYQLAQSLAEARSQAQRATVQADIARATAALQGAEALMAKAVDSAWQEALGEGPISIEARAQLRLACAHMAEIAAAVCKTVYTLGGGSAVYLDNSLQRRFRDAHVATQHIVVSPATFELAGRVLLDEPVDSAML